jgi:hypothetical protein
MALIVFVSSCSRSQKDLFFDFTEPLNFAPDKISDSERKTVLKYVFGANFYHLAKADVVRKFSGSFTKSGMNQTLYLIWGGLNSDLENAAGWQVETLAYVAVFDGVKSVFNEKLYTTDILKTTDFNDDGKNEILFESEFSNMGASTVSAQLRQIEDEKILDIKDFGSVYTDNSLSNEDCRQKAAKIFYLPFEQRFSFSYFESDCGEPARQRELSENPFREVL